MLRKTCIPNVLQFKNERICSGISGLGGSLTPIEDKVNGYAPENMAIERICSGIRLRRGLKTVDFRIISV